MKGKTRKGKQEDGFEVLSIGSSEHVSEGATPSDCSQSDRLGDEDIQGSMTCSEALANYILSTPVVHHPPPPSAASDQWTIGPAQSTKSVSAGPEPAVGLVVQGDPRLSISWVMVPLTVLLLAGVVAVLTRSEPSPWGSPVAFTILDSLNKSAADALVDAAAFRDFSTLATQHSLQIAQNLEAAATKFVDLSAHAKLHQDALTLINASQVEAVHDSILRVALDSRQYMVDSEELRMNESYRLRGISDVAGVLGHRLVATRALLQEQSKPWTLKADREEMLALLEGEMARVSTTLQQQLVLLDAPGGGHHAMQAHQLRVEKLRREMERIRRNIMLLAPGLRAEQLRQNLTSRFKASEAEHNEQMYKDCWFFGKQYKSKALKAVQDADRALAAAEGLEGFLAYWDTLEYSMWLVSRAYDGIKQQQAKASHLVGGVRVLLLKASDFSRHSEHSALCGKALAVLEATTRDAAELLEASEGKLMNQDQTLL